MSDPPKTLVRGYTQVDAFGPSTEYESDSEEVCYVTLDLGAVEPTLVPSSSAFRLIGLDTPTPYLQLAGTVFKGAHRELLGTELIFTDGKAEAGHATHTIAHVANTSQRIHFRQVELVPKDANPPGSEPEIAQSSKGKGKGKVTAAKGKGKAKVDAGKGKQKEQGGSGKGKQKAVEGDVPEEEREYDTAPLMFAEADFSMVDAALENKKPPRKKPGRKSKKEKEAMERDRLEREAAAAAAAAAVQQHDSIPPPVDGEPMDTGEG